MSFAYNADSGEDINLSPVNNSGNDDTGGGGSGNMDLGLSGMTHGVSNTSDSSSNSFTEHAMKMAPSLLNFNNGTFTKIGAQIGTMIFPGIGSGVGAAVGAVVDLGLGIFQWQQDKDAKAAQEEEDRRTQALNLQLHGEDVARDEKWAAISEEDKQKTEAERQKEYTLNRNDEQASTNWNRFMSVMGTQFQMANDEKTSTAMQNAWLRRG